MATIVLDTNALGITPPLGSNEVRRALDESKQGRIRLAVPELVVQEAVNCWAEELVSREDKYLAALANLRRLDIEVGLDQTLDHEQLRSDRERGVRTALADAGAEILPFPSVAHEEVAARALARRQPFDKQGKDGYRDVLIWESA